MKDTSCPTYHVHNNFGSTLALKARKAMFILHLV